MEGCNLLGGVEWGVAVKRDGQSVWIGGMAARVGVFRGFLKTLTVCLLNSTSLYECSQK